MLLWLVASASEFTGVIAQHGREVELVHANANVEASPDSQPVYRPQRLFESLDIGVDLQVDRGIRSFYGFGNRRTTRP